METSKKEWLNPNGVYSDYGISTSTLAKWRMENKHLSFSNIGKYIKYKRSDIEAFLRQLLLILSRYQNEYK